MTGYRNYRPKLVSVANLVSVACHLSF